MQPWDIKSQFLEAVKYKGGFVNSHSHFDKAYYISRETLPKSMIPMQDKWLMSDDIKRNSTQEQVHERIRRCLDKMVDQGSTLAMTFVDAYSAVGHKAIDSANSVKREYAVKIVLKTAAQPLGGLIEKEARSLYEEVVAKADFVGGLPSFDRPSDDKSFDILFSIAKNLNKPIHCHVDQENNPHERDTEKLVKYTRKHGYEGRVVAIHCVSVSAQPKEYRKNIFKEMAEIGMPVIVCPSAALSMRQLDKYISPVHNSIANVPEMLEAGVTVGIGSDNMQDFYQPFIDGDMYTEIRMLAESCRFYDFDSLVDIATTNGRKILSIT